MKFNVPDDLADMFGEVEEDPLRAQIRPNGSAVTGGAPADFQAPGPIDDILESLYGEEYVSQLRDDVRKEALRRLLPTVDELAKTDPDIADSFGRYLRERLAS